MSKLLSLLAVGLALSLGTAAHAAEDKAAPTKQQSKMAACNADEKAKTLKGDERKAFMSECLKNKPATQQDKMKACNADEKAKTLKGDERKAFMSECLKK
ncbi:PsiF family protein [Acidovorax sp. RAC01]|uniref:PsiF family protein n=1 Tax=Acidovorax sp. RAC01 TaxID=1842533 RepID=UPI00083E71E7|nr:PsiF family protein [Acidovorax sp. RAC01]AOG23095.1 psiF repeat family protein [Acidovorax sp. RAC01]